MCIAVTTEQSEKGGSFWNTRRLLTVLCAQSPQASKRLFDQWVSNINHPAALTKCRVSFGGLKEGWCQHP